MQLTPIPWGKRDRALGKMVCQHMVDIGPVILIPFHPLKHSRLLQELGHLGIRAYNPPRENDHAV